VQIFDSKIQAKILEEKISEAVSEGCGAGKVLSIIQVGDDESSSKFIDLKVKLCEKYGILCEVTKIDELKDDEEIFKIVEAVFLD